MKKILFVASECVPFIKTGGLADVVGSLPKYFDKDEFDIRVMLPKYLCIKQEWRDKMEYVTHFYMNLAWRSQYVGILQLEYEGIKFYFIDNEYYFNGTKPYGNIYEDIEKFAFFSKASISALPSLDFRPDIIHCHDWQTGLVPVYLNALFQDNPFFRGIKTVMTIHNLKFQGIWDVKSVKDITGIPASYFTPDKLEAYGDANYLKGGIVYADAVTTVSETYAEEIKMPYYGEHLDGLMRARSNSLRGIVNGIDYDEYNPATDKFLARNYDASNFRKEKVKNKTALQAELGLEADPKVMMIGVVSRLTDQKGFDLIAYVMDQLCQDAIQLVVLGTGEERYENMFRHYAWKYQGKVSANIFYSEALSHKIYGSCDAFLMPSQFEPCGLSQLMSLRYGTVPIVRETGGLKDTVEPYNEYESTGTGFSFANYNAHEMLHTVQYAERIFYDKKREWNRIVDRAMARDYSWAASAKKYEEMYNWLGGWNTAPVEVKEEAAAEAPAVSEAAAPAEAPEAAESAPEAEVATADAEAPAEAPAAEESACAEEAPAAEPAAPAAEEAAPASAEAVEAPEVTAAEAPASEEPAAVETAPDTEAPAAVEPVEAPASDAPKTAPKAKKTSKKRTSKSGTKK